jgi:hypothetical protein
MVLEQAAVIAVHAVLPAELKFLERIRELPV